MTKNFEFSIVMLVHNSELFLKDAIDSVIKQSIGFKGNIQLILVINPSIDESLDIALEYQKEFPDNILILENENSDYASSRNLAISHIKGKYVNFFEATDYFSSNAVKTIQQAFNKYGDETDVVSLPISILDEEDDVSKIEYGGEHLVDLNNEYEYSNILMQSSFIKSMLLYDSIFPDGKFFPEDKFLINNILINKNKIAFVDNATYYLRKRKEFESDVMNAEYCFNKLDIFDNLFITSLDKFGHVPKFLQYALLEEFSYFIKIEYLENTFEDKSDSNLFLKRFNAVLRYFDFNVIENHDMIPNYVKKFFAYLNNNDFHIETNGHEVFVKTGNYVINNLQYNLFNIDFVELTDNFLNFAGSVTSSCYPANLSMIAIKKDGKGNENIYDGVYKDYPTTDRKKKTIFNIDWEFTNNFDFSVPVGKNETFQIDFKLIYTDDGNEIRFGVPVKFREFVGLSNLSNYFVKHSKIVLFKGRTFFCMPFSFKQMLKLEFKTFIRILKNHGPYFMYALMHRFLYLILFVFMRNKRIWLFIDRDFVADDNAEFLYKYCIKQDDGIKKYFIIDKSSSDFKRLKNELNTNIIPFGSLKHRMLYIFSEKIMSSQLTRRIVNPFSHKNSYLFEGVSTYDFCFLQHGVILHDLSSWIRKYNKNLYLFVTSADAERDSIVNGYYNYDADRVQVLGLSRYDNLQSDSKKEILFIPTWRRNLDTREDIINSDYLSSLNSFLNNEKLIKYADEHGYSLAFRPHPDLWKFVDLFDINEKFRIADESYQQLFKTSSVMVTDYSSVGFDFAYLKKPLIYYHRESFDEFHYNKGYFNYQTMGFGDVVKTEDELVNKIIEYIDNDCVMEDEYKLRVERFFKYNDKNNCKRIYDWLISH